PRGSGVGSLAGVAWSMGGSVTPGGLPGRPSALPLGELTSAAYVHYQDRAVQHLLSVACGLESMVIGESQILGQVRQAVKLARQHGTLSRELSDVSRLALRVGRRARADTGIDAAGQNLVTRGLELAARPGAAAPSGQPSASRSPGALAGASVLVIGAGAMRALSVGTALRQGAAQGVIANRTRARATRLAARYGARAAGLAELADLIAAADLVVTCTGAAGHVLTESLVGQALADRSGRPEATGPLVLLDLALPRDIETAVGQLPGVELIDLEVIGGNTAWAASEADIAAVRRIVAR